MDKRSKELALPALEDQDLADVAGGWGYGGCDGGASLYGFGGGFGGGYGSCGSPVYVMQQACPELYAARVVLTPLSPCDQGFGY